MITILEKTLIDTNLLNVNESKIIDTLDIYFNSSKEIIFRLSKPEYRKYYDNRYKNEYVLKTQELFSKDSISLSLIELKRKNDKTFNKIKEYFNLHSIELFNNYQKWLITKDNQYILNIKKIAYEVILKGVK